ncbi:GNAT family N-acetyltransferase [Metaclostridioides mangenotii]|uniref:ElaA protein n=1 Tax=Metaclostridioides mangenotii TaxID=1540 RepID=A0ABS4ECA0_9FIRM|nr:GNAT family N-acetyltransferase [Clostridioides mangenotii]MBP1855560.1 ElaA protein [Clostridioides mangenotii]
MNFQIKKFEDLTADEIYEILRIRSEVFVVEQNCAFQDCDNDDQNSYHIFTAENDRIVSYLRVLKKGISYNEISIGRVLVAKDHRDKGVAKELLIKAIEFIENTLNECEIRISAQEYLKEFYSSLGFEISSDMYLEDEIPHIEMYYNSSK